MSRETTINFCLESMIILIVSLYIIFSIISNMGKEGELRLSGVLLIVIVIVLIVAAIYFFVIQKGSISLTGQQQTINELPSQPTPRGVESPVGPLASTGEIPTSPTPRSTGESQTTTNASSPSEIPSPPTPRQ